MFGTKKRQTSADVTEIGRSQSALKHGTDIEKQIQDISGDVGKMDFEKKKPGSSSASKKKKNARSRAERVKSIEVPKTVQQSIPYRRV